MLRSWEIRTSAISILGLVDVVEQVTLRLGGLSDHLLYGSRFLIHKSIMGILADHLEAIANILLRQFENLSGTSFAHCDFTKIECPFVRVVFGPKIVEAVYEKFGRNLRLLLDAKGIDGFTAIGVRLSAFADLL